MQSDRNSSKIDTLMTNEPTTYDPHVLTRSEQIITFARHKHGQVETFRIEKR